MSLTERRCASHYVQLKRPKRVKRGLGRRRAALATKPRARQVEEDRDHKRETRRRRGRRGDKSATEKEARAHDPYSSRIVGCPAGMYGSSAQHQMDPGAKQPLTCFVIAVGTAGKRDMPDGRQGCRGPCQGSRGQYSKVIARTLVGTGCP